MAGKRRRKRLTFKRLLPLCAAIILALVLFPDRAIAALLLAGVAGAIFFVLKSVLKSPRGKTERSIHVGQVEGLDQMLNLRPDQFEEYTGQLLVANGYKSMKRNGGAVDRGADLLGNDPDGLTVAVQCKRYAPGKKVTAREMQLFIGMQQVHHKTERGIYVTTSEYTSSARDLANEHGVWLINGSGLMELRQRGAPAPRRERSWIGGIVESIR